MTVLHVTSRVTLWSPSLGVRCGRGQLQKEKLPRSGAGTQVGIPGRPRDGRKRSCGQGHGYLSKSFRFLGEGHSSWKLAHAHTLAWLSTRYFRWECTCRTTEVGGITMSPPRSPTPGALEHGTETDGGPPVDESHGCFKRREKQVSWRL